MSLPSRAQYEQEWWNRIFAEFGNKRPSYDDWLQKYSGLFAAAQDTPVIDLGCGAGNNTLYLAEQGYQVISCDFAETALHRLSHFVTNPVTRHFDLRSKFPFTDGAANVVVADLCLHYFSEAETTGIIAEIWRVLCNGGWLLSRVNSVKDRHHGAGEGVPIEPSYYELSGARKRFFDESSLRHFFAKWNISTLREYSMHRYEHPKVVWELAAQKPKA